MMLPKSEYVLILALFAILFGCTNLVEATDLAKPQSFDGMIIDSIVIENRNIYDTKQKKYDKFIFKAANKIHIRTQKKYIKREILLKINEQYTEVLAEESARILRQRLVLYDAWIEKEIYDENKLLVKVITIDQWSLAAGVDVRLEGDESRVKIGASEKNLFGQNRKISFYYINQSIDENYTEATIADKRLFGKKLLGHLSFSTNPLQKYLRVLLEKPFYDQSQQFGFFVSPKSKEGRVDYYAHDSLVAQSFYKGDNTVSELFYRIGSYQTKYLFRIGHTYNFEKNSSVNDIQLVEDSSFHAVNLGFAYSFYNYKKMLNINGFNYTEDFNGGLGFRLDYQKSFRSQDRSVLYDAIGLEINKNFFFDKSLFFLKFKNKNWIADGDRIRRTTLLNIKYYNQSVKHITLATNAAYVADNRTDSYELVTLGGGSGIRGADTYFATGDKKIVLNSEIRFLPQFSLLSFNIGWLLFSDIGNIVNNDQSFKWSETYTSFGAGFRIAFDQSSKNIIRVDFAYSKVNGWQLSFGSGQYFNAN